MQEMEETWVLSLDWEYPLEECLATHSNILAWRVPWHGQRNLAATVHGVTKRRTRLKLLSSHAVKLKDKYLKLTSNSRFDLGYLPLELLLFKSSNLWYLLQQLQKTNTVPSSVFSGFLFHLAFLMAQLVKNPPAMQETLVQFLGQEDLLEKR